MLLENGGYSMTDYMAGTATGPGYPSAMKSEKSDVTRKPKAKEMDRTAERMKPPPVIGPIFLYYADVSEEDLLRIASAKSKAEVRNQLRESLNIDEEEGFRTEILCDFHYHNYTFGVERGFTLDKISTFLSIMKHTLNESVAKKLLAGDAFDVFKRWLLKHSVERPPWSVGIFTHEDVKEITAYVHNTFLRHYQLYMYVCMVHCDIDVHTDNSINQASFEAPVKDPEEVYQETLRELRMANKAQHETSVDGHADDAEPDDKSAVVKRKVEEGIKQLLAKYEDKLKDQDEMFRSMLEG